MTFAPELLARANAFVRTCTQQNLTLALAESCTGGLLAGLITAVPGSSAVLRLGVVSYARDAKRQILKVPESALSHGEVSAQVAIAMAEGALSAGGKVVSAGGADLAAGITGIAGPGGGSAAKPVGLVYIAAVHKGSPAAAQRYLFGDAGREQVRMESVSAALGLLEGLVRT